MQRIQPRLHLDNLHVDVPYVWLINWSVLHVNNIYSWGIWYKPSGGEMWKYEHVSNEWWHSSLINQGIQKALEQIGVTFWFGSSWHTLKWDIIWTILTTKWPIQYIPNSIFSLLSTHSNFVQTCICYCEVWVRWKCLLKGICCGRWEACGCSGTRTNAEMVFSLGSGGKPTVRCFWCDSRSEQACPWIANKKESLSSPVSFIKLDMKLYGSKHSYCSFRTMNK